MILNILFYTPYNARSRDTETLIQAFIAQGHKVFVLTQAVEGDYHIACSKLGAQVHAHALIKGNPLFFFLRHSWYFMRFCGRNAIDIVYAHLETAALPAVLTQYFIRAKVFACRHVINEAYLLKNKNFILLNRIVYRLARNIIVVSQSCKDFMIHQEGVRESKIHLVFLAYNFSLYPSPDLLQVAEIKQKYHSQILLLTACRLIGPKRPELAIQVVKKLRQRGYDIKLLLLGAGPQFEDLRARITNEALANHVFLLGHQSNMVDYLTACDVVVHPSILDSSSVIIKEAGLQKKIVVACSGIGDVDSYLIDGENAFLVSVDKTVDEMTEVISRICGCKQDYSNVGVALQKKVIERFSWEKIIGQYDDFHEKLMSGMKP